MLAPRRRSWLPSIFLGRALVLATVDSSYSLPFLVHGTEVSLSSGIFRLLPTLRSFYREALAVFGSSVSKMSSWLDSENRIRFMEAGVSTDVRTDSIQ